MITIGMILIISATGRGGNLSVRSFWLVVGMLFVSCLLDMGLLFLASIIFDF